MNIINKELLNLFEEQFYNLFLNLLKFKRDKDLINIQTDNIYDEQLNKDISKNLPNQNLEDLTINYKDESFNSKIKLNKNLYYYRK